MVTKVPEAQKYADNIDQDQNIEIDIIQASSLWENLEVLEKEIAHAVLVTIDHVAPERTTPYQVTFLLADDQEVQRLNKLFRNIDKPTNVLSFPFGNQSTIPAAEPKPLGDVALAFETVQKEALQRGVEQNHYILHLVIHGLLHLLGYSHEGDQDANHMESLETQIMLSLGLHDPYKTHEIQGNL